jgi:3-hydroxyisobutyrate dehydrogenase
MSTKIGFAGLGIMGQGMASNILSKKYPLSVWNRTKKRSETIESEGATVVDTPAELAAESDIIIVCVSDTPDVEAVILGEDGIIHGIEPGKLVIDMSTISPKATRAMAQALKEKGASMLDAPISGGSEGAANGTLSIMVGGDASDFERALPVFEAMGKTVTHVGPIGSGQTVKLVNQILVVVTALGVSEALVFAEAGGLDLDKTLAAVSGGAAGSWMLSHRGPQVVERDWRPGFTIDLQQKDLRLALEAANELGVPLMGTSLVHQLYQSLQRQGLGLEGNHALVKAIEKMSGVEVGAPREAQD